MPQYAVDDLNTFYILCDTFLELYENSIQEKKLQIIDKQTILDHLENKTFTFFNQNHYCIHCVKAKIKLYKDKKYIEHFNEFSCKEVFITIMVNTNYENFNFFDMAFNSEYDKIPVIHRGEFKEEQVSNFKYTKARFQYETISYDDFLSELRSETLIITHNDKNLTEIVNNLVSPNYYVERVGSGEEYIIKEYSKTKHALKNG